MENNKIISGIYMIKNIINNKIYIGESVNIFKRWEEHKDSLKNNKHHSIKLQNDYNIYGEDNFEYKILKVIEDEEKSFYILTMERIYIEGQYIDKYQTIKCGYNSENTFNEIIDNKKYRLDKGLDYKYLLWLKENGILTNAEKREKEKRNIYKKLLKNGLNKFKNDCKSAVFKNEFTYYDFRNVFVNKLGVNIKKLNELLVEKGVMINKNTFSENSIKSKNFELRKDDGVLSMNYEGYKMICNLIYEYGNKEEKSVFTQKYMKYKKPISTIKEYKIVY